MKKYSKPNTDITYLQLEGQLLTMSQDGDTLKGGENGEYTESGGITLGSRRNSVWGDDEDE